MNQVARGAVSDKSDKVAFRGIRGIEHLEKWRVALALRCPTVISDSFKADHAYDLGIMLPGFSSVEAASHGPFAKVFLVIKRHEPNRARHWMPRANAGNLNQSGHPAPVIVGAGAILF